MARSALCGGVECQHFWCNTAIKWNPFDNSLSPALGFRGRSKEPVKSEKLRRLGRSSASTTPLKSGSLPASVDGLQPHWLHARALRKGPRLRCLVGGAQEVRMESLVAALSAVPTEAALQKGTWPVAVGIGPASNPLE